MLQLKRQYMDQHPIAKETTLSSSNKLCNTPCQAGVGNQTTLTLLRIVYQSLTQSNGRTSAGNCSLPCLKAAHLLVDGPFL
jgi:hypothetical protein